MGSCDLAEAAAYAATKHRNWDDARRLCAVRSITDRSNVMDYKIRDPQKQSISRMYEPNQNEVIIVYYFGKIREMSLSFHMPEHSPYLRY